MCEGGQVWGHARRRGYATAEIWPKSDSQLRLNSGPLSKSIRTRYPLRKTANSGPPLLAISKRLPLLFLNRARSWARSRLVDPKRRRRFSRSKPPGRRFELKVCGSPSAKVVHFKKTLIFFKKLRPSPGGEGRFFS